MSENTNVDANTPIIVGVGQSIFREEVLESSPSPADIAAIAAKRAIDDTSCIAIADAIDTLAVVRIFAESYSKTHHPCGGSNNLPRSVANRLSINPDALIYSDVGGHNPQRLVNEMAEKIFNRQAEVVLLTGSEAIGFEKQARRKNVSVDWSEEVDPICEDRGLGKAMVSGGEIANGMLAPTQIYPLFEHAWRVKNGFTREQHRTVMADLFASFNTVAADNAYAFFPQHRTANQLTEVTNENFMVADPYTKRIVAQDAVNMGAAVLLTSVNKAKNLGVPENKWVFLHGYGDADDRLVSKRCDLAASQAIAGAGRVALSAANISIEDIGPVDLYSCFPCAVLIAAESLGLDWRDSNRPLTVTGGLPFAGGAGNNYSMHAIATMVEKLRAEPASYGLIQANGGFLSKESVGIYSAKARKNWRPVDSESAQQSVDSVPPVEYATDLSQSFTVESYTVVYKRGEPVFAYVVARDARNCRALAKVRSGDRESLQVFLEGEPVGRKIQITAGEKANYLNFV